jgi:hypothetical protein
MVPVIGNNNLKFLRKAKINLFFRHFINHKIYLHGRFKYIDALVVNISKILRVLVVQMSQRMPLVFFMSASTFKMLTVLCLISQGIFFLTKRMFNILWMDVFWIDFVVWYLILGYKGSTKTLHVLLNRFNTL